MSGMVHIEDGKSWMVASWVYDNVFSSVMSKLPTEQHGELLSVLDKGMPPKLRFIRLSDIQTSDRRVLLKTLKEVREDYQASEGKSFASPEFFRGFMTQLDRLIDKVAESLDNSA
jgi:hypothetical protein